MPLRSNVTGPLVLLDACLQRNLYLVHLGSGCVFDGDNQGRGFSEHDPPNFFGSFYSQTKSWADGILDAFPVLILRVRMPFDDSLHERTLLGKLVKYRKVLDARNSLTYIPDLLDAARRLVEGRRVGIFHIANPGVTSPYRIMLRYRELVDPQHSFERISPDELDGLTRARRCNCRLATDKLAAAGITLQPIDEAVEDALRRISRRSARATGQARA
jgi:dTDP-4-dehydrorhamnose reductase